MIMYEVISEENELKLTITKKDGKGYYLLEVYPIDSDKVEANYLYYKLDDLFSVAQKKYKINQDEWKNVTLSMQKRITK
jgi:hypothetical protein